MTNPNDPAFPDPDDCAPERGGLTKREYFAGLAMQGLLAMYAHPNMNLALLNKEELASNSLLAADALIAALSKTEEK